MSREREEIQRAEQTLKEDLERAGAALNEEDEQRQRQLADDFKAKVEAGIIDPEKIAKYLGIAEKKAQAALAEAKPIDAITLDAAMREVREAALAHQNWSRLGRGSGKLISFTTPTASWVLTTGNKKDQAHAHVFNNSADLKASVEGGTVWKTEKKKKTVESFIGNSAIAMAGFRYEIAAQHVPSYGKIEVWPVVNILGWTTQGTLNPLPETYNRLEVGLVMSVSQYPAGTTDYMAKPHYFREDEMKTYAWKVLQYPASGGSAAVKQAKLALDVSGANPVEVVLYLFVKCFAAGSYNSSYADLAQSSLHATVQEIDLVWVEDWVPIRVPGLPVGETAMFPAHLLEYKPAK